ncbi:MAG: hypothetical protein IJL51_06775 [Oscillospiraceae bacterium]|nr:hypothetical protein [Oscillospiraceae bacterium]
MKSEILLDAIGEIREAFIREAAADSRRSRFWLKTAIPAAAVLILCFAAIFITRLGHRTPPVPPPELGPLISEAPAGASEEENILWYHNLSFTDEAASYDSPATVDLCVFRDAVFTDEEIDSAVLRLQEAGWTDMTSTKYHDGSLVFFSQPEEDPKTLDETIEAKRNPPAGITDADVEHARQFISDSGLDQLIFEKTGVTLVLEAVPARNDVVFYGYYDGLETGSYIRMSFYDNGDLAEAKLYAVVPEKRTVSALPLAEAKEHAFRGILYGGGDDYEPHEVRSVRFEYRDGLPYYILTLDETVANGPVELRALAIDFSVIKNDERLHAQWAKHFDLP